MGRACTILLVPLLALGAMLICGYSYGTDDQAQYLVQVLALEHPEAFPLDAYTEVFGSLGSFFWYPVAWFSNDVTRPVFLLGLTLAITILNIELLRRLGSVLVGQGHWAFLPALLLVVPKERNWFGLVGVCDHELTATMGVLPLVFSTLLAWVKGRPFVALVLCTLAVVVHAQTGAAMLVTWWSAVTLLAVGDSRWRKVSVVVGVFGLGSVLFAGLTLHLPPETRDLCRAVGDDLFAALIDPLAAAPKSWAAVGVLLLLGFIAAIRSLAFPASSFFSPHRSSSLPRASWWRGGEVVPSSAYAPPTLLLLWAFASLVFPIVGTLLHALGLDEPLLWRLMVGRGFQMPQICAVVLISIWCSRYDSGFGVVVTAALLVVLSWWPFSHLPAPIAASALSFLVLAILVRPHRRLDDLKPADPAPDSIDPEPALATRSHPLGAPDPRLLFAAIIPLVILARFGWDNARWLGTHADPAWREAQVWARKNTPLDALFITPPYLTGWRLESIRTTFGEGKDGGLTFYAADRVLDWDRRMDLVALDRPCNWELWEAATLGNTQADAASNNHPLTAPLFADYTTARDNYHAALRVNLDAILVEFEAADETDPVYVVTEADLGLGEAAWHNDRFWISRVK